MQDVQNSIDVSLAGLEGADWKQALEDIAEEHGIFQPLGETHFATQIDAGKTLLVSFESITGIHQASDQARPFGFEMIISQGWSHLGLICDGDTWFRDGRVYGYFDRLIDDGFFEEFERVVFYGAGPCGYAAAAYSVASPGATVIAIQPQATMDPRMTEWDPRFPEIRRVSFTDRYGYAPDMLDAAAAAFVFYDPREDLDAMHASLFRRDNVTRLRMTHMGRDLPARLEEMEMLEKLVVMAGDGTLNAAAFHRLYRARRSNGTYLRALMARLDAEHRPYLNLLLCRNVTRRLRAPRLRRRLDGLLKQAARGDFTPPPPLPETT